jgi:hypothetical protein
VVEESFMFGAKPAHRIPKGQHGPHRGEGFVGVSLDVLPECKGAIKKEPQVAPRGARPERGGPRVGGVAEVDVRVDIAVLPREVKPFGFGVLEDQAHGLGQFVHDSISSYELREVRFKRGGLRHNGAIVHELMLLPERASWMCRMAMDLASSPAWKCLVIVIQSLESSGERRFKGSGDPSPFCHVSSPSCSLLSSSGWLLPVLGCCWFSCACWDAFLCGRYNNSLNGMKTTELQAVEH